MTTQDLIELTTLHALGLLDESESGAYEEALAGALPQVRARVLSEARRLGDLGDLLPADEPPAELRERAIAAVRAAMRDSQTDSQTHTHAAPAVVATIGPNTQHAQPKLSTSPRVHRMWRAASIGLAAAAVAMAVMTQQQNQAYQDLNNEQLFADSYDAFGAQFIEDMMLDPNTNRRILSVSNPANAASQAAVSASIITHPDWEGTQLWVKNLRSAADAPFKLVILDAEGNIVQEVGEFTSEGEFGVFEINANLASESKIAIYEQVESELAQTPLLVTSDI